MEGTLLQIVRRYCSSASDAEEILQEAYLRIYEASLAGPPVQIDNTEAWISTIVRHKAIDRIRHNQARPLDFPGDDAAVFDVADGAPPIEDALTSVQELALAREAIERMPPRRRQVFWRRRVLGHSQEQIAKDLGIKLNTVEVHLQEGRTEFAKHLTEIDAARGTDLASRFLKRTNQG